MEKTLLCHPQFNAGLMADSVLCLERPKAVGRRQCSLDDTSGVKSSKGFEKNIEL